MKLFGYFTVDFWTLLGFFGQALFMLSFVVQWWMSEKKKESHLPKAFWVLRMLGAFILIAYVIKRQDIVILVGNVLQVFIYARNLALIKKQEGV